MATAKRHAIPVEAAESLAIQALAFLAEDAERLGRFLAVTGIGPEEIRATASETNLLAGILDYLAADEPLLIEFAAHAGVDPADVARAWALLGRGSWERDSP